MTYRAVISNRLAVSVVTFLLGAMLTSALRAQVAPPPGYPAPNPVYPANSAPMPMQPQPTPPKSHYIRELFAGTLAAVLQAATGGFAGAVNGSITNWFAKKGKGPAQGYPAAGYDPNQMGSQGAAPYPNTGYPEASAYPSAQAPVYPGYTDPAANAYPAAPAYPAPESGYPSTAYPSPQYPTQATDPAAASQAYATQAGGYPPGTQVYDPRTGQIATGSDNPYATPAGGYDGTLYAGIAYEVHALSPDGSSTPINAATYVFRTGDKFMVYYRPSLPGRMEVYNINPAGQQTLIDANNMAAGQMTGLGPYQFTNLTGDESLRLVLSPCSNSQLLAATRDIVRVDAAPQMSGGVQLANCDAPTTRGLEVRTRDIQKVAVDGMTSFALDPVSQQERASGQVTPREATIVFHHR